MGHTDKLKSDSRLEHYAEVVRAALAALTLDERSAVLALVNTVEGITVEHALLVTHGNVSAAARVLGVSRRTVQVRMKKLGIPPGHAGRRSKIA